MSLSVYIMSMYVLPDLVQVKSNTLLVTLRFQSLVAALQWHWYSDIDTKFDSIALSNERVGNTGIGLRLPASQGTKAGVQGLQDEGKQDSRGLGKPYATLLKTLMQC